ncbi:MAG: hypothetical protein ACRCS9_05660 [Hyphomicrobium sp.]
MSEPNFGPLGDDPADDLPRTFRREKEARERQARENAARERAAAPSLSTPAPKSAAPASVSGSMAGAPSPKLSADLGSTAPTSAASEETLVYDVPYPAVVRRFDVPFFHLMGFFLKAVLAAIPALILLTAVLWIFGALLQSLFPELIKLKILIGFQG